MFETRQEIQSLILVVNIGGQSFTKPHKKVEPMAGIEPATDGLRNRITTC
jgi:hypothetical protein